MIDTETIEIEIIERNEGVVQEIDENLVQDHKKDLEVIQEDIIKKDEYV